MFPLNSNLPYIKDDGTRDKLGNVIGSGGGGGGGSYTPDYEHDILIIGEHEDWEYYIPMNKRYAGDGIWGYEIKTNPESSSGTAMIDLYSLIYIDGEITHKTKIKTLVHNGDKDYSDEWITITYSGSSWSVTFSEPLYQEDGTAYTSPVTWLYSATVDYVMLTEDPTT